MHGSGRIDRRGECLGARPREPVRLARERAAAVQPRDPDRAGERVHDEDRPDATDGVLDRLLRAEPRLEPGRAGDRVGGQRRDHAGHVVGRPRPDRRGLPVPVPCGGVDAGDVHVPRSADVLERADRRLGRAGDRRGARADDRCRQLGRRWRHVGADDRRARARRAWCCDRRDRAPLARGPFADVTARRRATVAAAAVALALLVPAAASAHAYIVKTVPAASVILSRAPTSVQLTYDEAVEPRFAIVSVTDVHARQETTGPVTRSPSDPDTLVVPIRHVGEGWYLVYWRAISVDGHPVQGAFTFAVGPNAGPAPQFTIPHVAGTATSTPLVSAKWLAFLTVMIAIGLFVLRIAIVRPLVRRVSGTSLRPLSIAFGIVAGLALIAIPAYLEEAVAIDSLRSFWDVTGVVPLWRLTAFGRGYVDVWLCFGLFVAAAAVAIW